MLPARLQRAYGVIYTLEPMGKPIGYNPARLQRAYLPIKGTEHLLFRENCDCKTVFFTLW